VDNERYGKTALWHTLFALRDFPKLREVADVLMHTARKSGLYLDEWEDALVASLLTESHETVFRKLESAPFESYEGNSDVIENPFERLVTTSISISQTHAIDYAIRRGFKKTYYFGFLKPSKPA
jgi:hypothetical protein